MNQPTQTTGKRSQLGEILVEQGKLTRDELEAALAYRLENGLKLGQALVTLGLVSQGDLALALKNQGKVHCIHLTPEIVDPSVARELGEERSRKLQAVAIHRIAGVVTVAMEDPSEVYNVDAISLHLKSPVLAVHAEPEAIASCIDAVFVAARGPGAGGRELERILASDGAAQTALDLSIAREEDTPAGESIQAPVVHMLRALIDEAIAAGASDIHFDPRQDGLQVRFRVDGVLFGRVLLPRSWAQSTLARLKILSNLDIAEHRLPQEGRAQAEIDGRRVDLRVATTPTLYGEGAVVRLLDSSRQLRDLDALQIAPRELQLLRQIVDGGEGLLLATGPTGSGKSTTLYALLQHLDAAQTKIVTVEDPVEKQLEGTTQINVNGKIGLTFACGLRSILRQDPDVILVGEIRDRETAEIAVQAAMTGHLLLSTLHTLGTAESVTRLSDMGIEPYLLADTLRGIVAQRLVRRICRSCRRETQATPEMLARLQLPEGLRFYEGAGCSECQHSGYRGRIALCEVLAFDRELAAFVRRREGADALRAAAVERGLVTLREDGMRHALAGETTLAEVYYATAHSSA